MYCRRQRSGWARVVGGGIAVYINAACINVALLAADGVSRFIDRKGVLTTAVPVTYRKTRVFVY